MRFRKTAVQEHSLASQILVLQSTRSRASAILGEHPEDPSTLIPPVVVSILPICDDTAALEQVRNMLSVKHNQEALVEQRSGRLRDPSLSTSNPPTPRMPALPLLSKASARVPHGPGLFPSSPSSPSWLPRVDHPRLARGRR
ncbi:hypothetical protein OF83DRAFT_1178235 [Amylostereum chailletii]|nr:hypothetical protein OF83DRAFT_1178235 [Amylostereum chailletii]